MSRRVLALVVLLLILSTACTKLVEEEPTPTPLATPSDANKPIFTANLRFLSASLAALGRDIEAHEVAHLLLRDLVSRMRCESRIVHRFDARMRLQHRRHCARVLAMHTHAGGE